MIHAPIPAAKTAPIDAPKDPADPVEVEVAAAPAEVTDPVRLEAAAPVPVVVAPVAVAVVAAVVGTCGGAKS